ncbi:TIGR00730 family Rossman fold protein [Dysgonomonas sp. Marseille-P4677]|uniref:LOG family protein n=1 Tax=Dysgonomonas sp. Marseille-P4677 TaxID=2364790 RepID=UPI00191366CD|nr:TIGR00730 family Rossman fold protein [Dysgonomonas sp. Marseille-P4677]MBK5721716.1 TIGR00730 family Rossman fold protein [Dysgonomonas sp. Marseille-P4677]
MKYIAVFCGSSSGNGGEFIEQATSLGEIIARKGYGLVYGGAHVGLMGAVADGVLSQGGEVIGVIPEFLKKKELEHKSITKIHVVETMHDRKALMNELSDAVIALPGGYGTLEELFEMLTWSQLALHKKAIGILNVNGYYDPLIEMSEKMIEKGFLKEEYRKLLIVESKVDNLLDKMHKFEPLKNDKWFEVK